MNEGSFSNTLKKLRLEKRYTLRQFCRIALMDPSNYSRVERGIAPPPPSIQIKAWLKHLGVSPEDERYQLMLDRATVERGDLPRDVLTPRFQSLLPVLFRTVRSDRLTEKQYTNLVKMLEKSNEQHQN